MLLSLIYYFYTLSVQGAYFRASYAQNTADVLHALKFGMELSLQQEDYASLQKIFAWAKQEHYVKFIVLVSEDSTVVAKFPDNLIWDNTYLSVKPSLQDENYILKNKFVSSITKGTFLVGFSTQIIRDYESKILFDVTVSTIIFIILSILFGTLFSHGITNPLEELRNVTEKIATGETDKRVTLKKGTDEILSVSTSFNTMVDRVLSAKKDLENDLLEAAEFVKAILPAPMKHPLPIDWRFIPSKRLGGDAFGYDFLDPNTLAFYLLDVSGHGLGAALLSVAVLNMLRSKSLKDADFKNPTSVLQALNTSFQMENYGDKYFTMWYGVLDLQTMQLKYSSAGHPPAFVVRRTDGTKEVLKIGNSNFFVGGMPDYDFNTDTVTLAKNDIIFLFSDGVYELEKEDGSMMTLDEFNTFLTRCCERPFELDFLIQELEKIKKPGPFEDDFSLLRITLQF